MTTTQRLTKGLEEEVYTGLENGEIVGLSHKVAAALEQFVTEPDARNSEFATRPFREYQRVCQSLIQLRQTLREFIATLGPYTLVPGGTLSLRDDGIMIRSKPDNPYHAWIEKAYGTRVVTASAHLNIGIEDPEVLLRAWRVVRAEAPMFLALTATSPFLDGEVTGWHSARWHRFPKTPEVVPYFPDHAAYVAWIEAQLASGAMQNIRHLWMAVRPNGEAAPHDLNRLELRICDRISNPVWLIAVTAFLEARVLSVMADADLDPLRFSDDAALQQMSLENEEAVSEKSLQARIRPWQGGPAIAADKAIAGLIDTVRPFAGDYGFDTCLAALEEILDRGNVAQQWLSKVKGGTSIEDILREAIVEAAAQEREFLAGCSCGANTV